MTISLWANILYWTGWTVLTSGVVVIILCFGDPVGYRGKRRRPARIVTVTAGVAAVISGWQPRLSRIP